VNDSDKILLYCGIFNCGKRIDNLIKIISLLTRNRNDIKLKLVGDGPHKNQLQALSKQMNLEQFVIFEGFKQKEEMPKHLAEANIFLFPSEYDIWGLVLVEAMAAGLPCISSIHSGATEDLIQDGIPGSRRFQRA
jgi:glycosyltransferase involved in cell wall biosynthesis